MPEVTYDKYSAVEKIFQAIGINANVDFHKKENFTDYLLPDGLKSGLIFRDNAALKDDLLGGAMSLGELNAKLEEASAALKQQAASKNVEEAKIAKGKLAWIASFRKFVFEQETDYPWISGVDDKKVAIISGETLLKAPFQQLLKNGGEIKGCSPDQMPSDADYEDCRARQNDIIDGSLKKLTPINWDLHAKDMNGVVKALNNIATMEGYGDIHFQLEKGTNRITYFSEMPKEEMRKKVTALVKHIVSTDKKLIDAQGRLTEQGQHVASQMDAFKIDRGYVAFEKETGFEPDYLVDMVENAQIAFAAQKYLNFKNVKVNNTEGYIAQGQTGPIRTEDGVGKFQDTYNYENWNLTSIKKKPIYSHDDNYVGAPNQMAPIPNLMTQDNPRTNKVTAQKEEDIIATLNLMRGALPPELSEPEIVLPSVPAKKASHPKTHQPRH